MCFWVFVRLSQNRLFSQSFNVNSFYYGVRLCVLHSHAGLQKSEGDENGLLRPAHDHPPPHHRPRATEHCGDALGSRSPTGMERRGIIRGSFYSASPRAMCTYPQSNYFPRAVKQRAAGLIFFRKMWEKEPLGFCSTVPVGQWCPLKTNVFFF